MAWLVGEEIEETRQQVRSVADFFLFVGKRRILIEFGDAKLSSPPH